MEPTAKGALWLSKLRDHGSKHAQSFSGDANLAGEECEREIEQEEEQEQEQEISIELPQLSPAAESAWPSPLAAVQLDSAKDFTASQGIEVGIAPPLHCPNPPLHMWSCMSVHHCEDMVVERTGYIRFCSAVT